ASLIGEALLHFDGDRYKLLAWCVMPNHVHFLIETFGLHPVESDESSITEARDTSKAHPNSLGGIAYSIKSYTAKEANKILRRRGTFWQRDYFDRYMRDDTQLRNVRLI